MSGAQDSFLDLCQLLTAFIYSENHCVTLNLFVFSGMLLILISTERSFLFLTSIHTTDSFLFLIPPPLSHRFQLYLQTT